MTRSRSSPLSPALLWARRLRLDRVPTLSLSSRSPLSSRPPIWRSNDNSRLCAAGPWCCPAGLRGGVPGLRTLCGADPSDGRAGDRGPSSGSSPLPRQSRGRAAVALLPLAGRAGETMPEDAELLAPRCLICAPQRQYGPSPGGDARFLLLHRRRAVAAARVLPSGSASGQAGGAQPLLRGAADTTFWGRWGAGGSAAARSVLTLDADTRLPRRRPAADRHPGAPA